MLREPCSRSGDVVWRVRRMDVSWAERVKKMRVKLGVNQERFGGLLGVSARAVGQWERGRAVPGELNGLMLRLLSGAMSVHPRQRVIDTLRRAGPDPVGLARALVWLERHPTPPPPPSSNV